jgi:hypothetical protein
VNFDSFRKKGKAKLPVDLPISIAIESYEERGMFVKSVNMAFTFTVFLDLFIACLRQQRSNRKMQTHGTRSAVDFSFCGFNLPLVVV